MLLVPYHHPCHVAEYVVYFTSLDKYTHIISKWTSIKIFRFKHIFINFDCEVVELMQKWHQYIGILLY